MNAGTARAAQQFVDFLSESEQQKIFVQYGFRPVNSPVNSTVDLQSVPQSPWSQKIPGATLPAQVMTPPKPEILTEIVRLWQRAN
jgi:ABC-type Fe3+ transport system substrate-binding protein